MVVCSAELQSRILNSPARRGSIRMLGECLVAHAKSSGVASTTMNADVRLQTPNTIATEKIIVKDDDEISTKNPRCSKQDDNLRVYLSALLPFLFP